LSLLAAAVLGQADNSAVPNLQDLPTAESVVHTLQARSAGGAENFRFARIIFRLQLANDFLGFWANPPPTVEV